METILEWLNIHLIDDDRRILTVNSLVERHSYVSDDDVDDWL